MGSFVVSAIQWACDGPDCGVQALTRVVIDGGAHSLPEGWSRVGDAKEPSGVFHREACLLAWVAALRVETKGEDGPTVADLGEVLVRT